MYSMQAEHPTFDQLNWSYLISLLKKLGFGHIWIKFDISSVKYSVLINRSPVGFFSPQRGLTQGDPLSPFLFIPAMEGLSRMPDIAKQMQSISHCDVGSRDTLNISHLLYANDTEIFCGAHRDQRFGQDLTQKSSEEPDAASLGWGGGFDRSGQSSSQGNNCGWLWYRDPRLDCLGFRGIFPSNTTPPLVEADKETNEENYLLWRLEKGVAEGPAEIPKGEAVPLEYNLAGLNGISFDKGCYVGQELIARTHHRGVIRKRLLPLKFVNDSGEEVEQKVAPKSEVIDASSGKKAGTVTTALGTRGLGLLRLDEAFKGSLTIRGLDDVKVKAIKPEWWPAEWLLDQQEQTAAA